MSIPMNCFANLVQAVLENGVKKATYYVNPREVVKGHLSRQTQNARTPEACRRHRRCAQLCRTPVHQKGERAGEVVPSE
jgi:hypothetical protein